MKSRTLKKNKKNKKKNLQTHINTTWLVWSMIDWQLMFQ